MAAGHILTRADVKALRPASALSPDQQDALVGLELARDMAAGMPFLVSDLEARDSLVAPGISPALTKDHRDVA